MSRNFGIIPQPTRIERAARIATAYLPVDDTPARLPPALCVCIIAGLGLLSWAPIAAFVWWLL